MKAKAFVENSQINLTVVDSCKLNTFDIPPNYSIIQLAISVDWSVSLSVGNSLFFDFQVNEVIIMYYFSQ